MDTTTRNQLKMIKNNKGAIEMSVGTIVTIVLMVTMLILGIVLISNIFKSAKGVVDLTDAQLNNEVNKLFSEEHEVTIFPDTRLVEIKQGAIDEVGLGIKNLQQGTTGEDTFSYTTAVTDVGNCGMSAEDIEKWIVLRGSESDIAIRNGESIIRRIRLQIPLGTPLCLAGFRVEVQLGGEPYQSDTFDIRVLPK